MKNPNSEIHLALSFDEIYLTPFYVLLTSIFFNNKGSNIIVHAIATGIDDLEKKKILEYVKLNQGEIHFYDIDKFYEIEFLNTPYLKSTDLTIATFYRLYFPFLFPENIKKLLYIDVDTVVIDRLESFYETNISPFPAGAAQDIAMFRNNDPILLKVGVEKENYFNAGVLLIDVEQWKKQKVSERALQFITDNLDILKYPDQDALNHVLKDNYYKFSNLYNFCWDDISIDLPKKEILKNKIVIIHYTAIKPWKALNYNRLRSYYYYYLKKSPHANRKKYTDFKWTKSCIKEFIKIRIREFYLDHTWIRNIWKKIKP